MAIVDFQSNNVVTLLIDSLKTTRSLVLTKITPVVLNELIQDVFNAWQDFMIRLHHDYQTSNMNTTTTTTTGNTTTTPIDNHTNKTNLAEMYNLNMIQQNGYLPTAVSETAKGSS